MHRNRLGIALVICSVLLLVILPVTVRAEGNSSPMPRERDPVCGAVLTIVALIGALDIFSIRNTPDKK